MIILDATRVWTSILILAVTASAGIDESEAKLMKWSLEDVVYDDGATATGFFILNGEGYSQYLTDVDIEVSGGGLRAFHYTNSSTDTNYNFVIGNINGGALLGLGGKPKVYRGLIFWGFARSLSLATSAPLTEAVGTVNLVSSQEGNLATEFGQQEIARFARGGELIGAPVSGTPIPEPSSGMLFGLFGVALILGAKSMRRTLEAVLSRLLPVASASASTRSM